jgi:hypothetical protein
MLAAVKQESHPLRLGKHSALARFMHRFLSRSDESADLTRRATEAPANVLYGTLRRPTERNTGGAQRTPDDFVAAVENLCIIRAGLSLSSNTSCVSRQDEFG